MKPIFKYILVFFLFSCFIHSANLLYAQSTKLTDKISFSANNITVSEALESLSRLTGINFSYNPDQLPANRIVKVDINNRALSEVIGAILNSSAYGYRQMGNQVIIYRNKNIPETPDQGEENERDNSRIPEADKSTEKQNLRPDTIIVYQNIHDTVVLIETVTKTDTVIERIETPVSSNQIFHVNLGKELTPEFKFEVGASFTYYFPFSVFSASEASTEKVKQYEDAYSNNSFAGTAGLEVRTNYKNWTAVSGLFLTRFSQKLDYSYLDKQGGFFRKDTLDPYFTIDNGDTTWYYIIDSTYIPIDNKLYNYKVNNHFNYFEIPITIQYNYAHNNVLFFMRTGLIPSIITGFSGHQIKPDQEGIINAEDIKAKTLVLSYMVAAGTAIPVNKKFTFRGSLQYRSHFGSIYKDFPIKTHFAAFGINAGISYKFY